MLGKRRRFLGITPVILSVAFLTAVGFHSRPSIAPPCGCESQATPTGPAGPQTDPGDLKGATAFVHDPAIAKERGKYYVFSTGPGIAMRESPDRLTWGEPVEVLTPRPAWADSTIPGNKGFYWAPDISYFQHRWHLYYAVSTFGRNRSAIGHATNVTLDPHRPDYKWVDEGPVFQSYPQDDYNAIDPNIAFDAKGTPWLSFGSFWTGIKLVPLDPKTGGAVSPAVRPLSIAGRRGQGDAVEAPFIVRHHRYYYLFVSFDFCCRGVRSTYNVRVGRSEKIEGPYVDRDGKPMMEGGGTMVVSSQGRWHGPGHNAFLHDGRQDFLVFHAYDGQRNGVPTLRIRPIVWDKSDWPTLPTGP